MSPPDRLVRRLRAAGCVFAEDEATLLVEAADSAAELDEMVQRRISGLPLEQVLGWAEFSGHRILVDPGVFVPRRRTELVVREALRALSERSGAESREPAVVVDLCCGTGAVAAVLAAESERPLEVHAADIDPAAVQCARRNLAPLGGQVHQGDLFDALPSALRGRVVVLAVNVPYVPSTSLELLPPEARLYEPRVALDGGRDGLDLARRVAAGAADWLLPGGRLIIETSDEQAADLAAAVTRGGLTATVVTADDLGATAIRGVRPG